MKDINIVFVNYHMKKDVLSAVESVVRDCNDSRVDAAITVVDNSQNKDNLRDELCTRFPSVSYVDAKQNVGFGKANTIGFQTTPARYYFALNPDTLLERGGKTIEAIIRFMDEHPKIGCIGPKLVNMDGSLQYACFRFNAASIFVKPLKHLRLDRKYGRIKKHVDRLDMRDFDHEKTQPVDWVLGAAMVVRKEVIDDIGWFDERYFMYMEDCDWCRTMWNHGWPVYYVHDIVIKHRHGRASAKVPGAFRALLKNRMARVHLGSWWKYLWKWRRTHKYYG